MMEGETCAHGMAETSAKVGLEMRLVKHQSHFTQNIDSIHIFHEEIRPS